MRGFLRAPLAFSAIALCAALLALSLASPRPLPAQDRSDLPEEAARRFRDDVSVGDPKTTGPEGGAAGSEAFPEDKSFEEIEAEQARQRAAASEAAGVPGTPPAASSPAPVEDESPVPVPEPSEKALRYHRSGNTFWVAGTLWGLLVPAVILFTGLSARLRDLAARLARRRWFFTIAVYVALFSVLVFLVDLPFDYCRGFVRPHAYGLSDQAFGKWIGDAVKGLAVSVVAGVVFLWVPYLLVRRSPRRWWLWTGLLVIPFLFFVMMISPVFIDPLFNRFGPMKDKALEARILDLASRAGIEGGRVYEVEKSVDTKTVNAYVTGFGSTKRIVLWDTLLQKLDDREVLAVMGHEMGHYVLRHVVTGVFFYSALILVSLFLAHLVSGWALARFGARFGFTELSDIASWPLVLLLLAAFQLGLAPLGLAYSRHCERESDRFALELTRDNRAGASAFARLQEENLSIPRHGILYTLWRSSHPSIGDRIDFFNTYRPWKTGEALRYGRHFREGASGAPSPGVTAPGASAPAGPGREGP